MECIELLTSAGVEVTNANLVNDHVMEMFYGMKDPFVEASDRTNVVLAAFTTAQARIKLCKVMQTARMLLRYGQFHLHGERG